MCRSIPWLHRLVVQSIQVQRPGIYTSNFVTTTLLAAADIHTGCRGHFVACSLLATGACDLVSPCSVSLVHVMQCLHIACSLLATGAHVVSLVRVMQCLHIACSLLATGACDLVSPCSVSLVHVMQCLHIACSLVFVIWCL